RATEVPTSNTVSGGACTTTLVGALSDASTSALTSTWLPSGSQKSTWAGTVPCTEGGHTSRCSGRMPTVAGPSGACTVASGGSPACSSALRTDTRITVI